MIWRVVAWFDFPLLCRCSPCLRGEVLFGHIYHHGGTENTERVHQKESQLDHYPVGLPVHIIHTAALARCLGDQPPDSLTVLTVFLSGPAQPLKRFQDSELASTPG